MPEDKQIADLQKEVDVREAIIADKQKEIDSDKQTIEDLQQENDSHKKTIADQEEMISRLAAQCDQLSALATGRKEAEQTATKNEPRAKPTVTSADGRSWKFKFAGFTFGSMRYAAEDASLNQDLIEKIISTEGQGILKELY